MNAYKDLFSEQASQYAAFRPTYPQRLYGYLALLTPHHDLAWDVATGNGQAAKALAKYYRKIIATDASEAQLQHAIQDSRIVYRQGFAEQSGLSDNSVDLITVAQAAHWFDLEPFYAEAHRVLKPGAVIAIWGYKRTTIAPSIDPIIEHYNRHTLGGYWDSRVRIVESGYQGVPFPFRELPVPPFSIEADWTLEQLMGYLFSWSATQEYIRQNGTDPLERVYELLAPRWGEPGTTRKVKWKLYLRVGRK